MNWTEGRKVSEGRKRRGRTVIRRPMAKHARARETAAKALGHP